ncbi:hypothetical protein MFLAVUS_006529 [Mucor flavus]|uniref:Uncharacterized protein n=1 Tax=Mucor flavus TaxID=439312 RepID=A0ABP9Z1S2_9FUNG
MTHRSLFFLFYFTMYTTKLKKSKFSGSHGIVLAYIAEVPSERKIGRRKKEEGKPLIIKGSNNNSDRRSLKERINNIAQFASNNDYKIIDILINCPNKLPNQEQLEDDIVSMLNTGVEDTEPLRPDGNLFELEQRRIKFSTGRVEVKSDKSRSDTSKTHDGLLRLDIMLQFIRSLLKPLDSIFLQKYPLVMSPVLHAI